MHSKLKLTCEGTLAAYQKVPPKVTPKVLTSPAQVLNAHSSNNGEDNRAARESSEVAASRKQGALVFTQEKWMRRGQ